MSWSQAELLSRARRHVANEPATSDDGRGVPALLRRTCRAAARALRVDGAGISLWSGDLGLAHAAASDSLAAELDELQFLLGEGPCLTSFATRAPVYVPDLRHSTQTRWMAYPTSAMNHGALAVFAFPIQLGRARLGVLDLYRAVPDMLSHEDVSLALAFAEMSFLDLLNASDDEEAVDALADEMAANRYEVFQAQGMLMVQLGITAADALLRLRVHAFTHDRRLAELARDIVNRTVTLSRDHD